MNIQFAVVLNIFVLLCMFVHDIMCMHGCMCISRILADLNLAVRYGIAICIHMRV